MSKNVGIVSFGIVLLLMTGVIQAANQSNIEARVFYSDKAQYLDILHRQLDIASRVDNYFVIITNPEEVSELQVAGFQVEIIHHNLAQFYRARMFARPTDMGGYKTLSEIYDALDVIIADHSDIVSARQSIGLTVQGRDMWAFKISDNHAIDEDEPEILFTAAIHAREVITPEVLLYFINHLTDNYGSDPQITELVDNREIWFVIPVNPDGYYYNEVIEPDGGGMWRKNRQFNGDGSRGVDLNRNFGYMWGYDNNGSSPTPSSSTYRGAGPFSEPETQNMRDFTESHEFVITVYYHSYSNLILWPWGYDRFLTPDDDIFSAMGDSIQAWNGYTAVPGWQFYLTNGDSDDWGYGEQTTKNKCFSITPEVGSNSDGFWPALYRVPELVQENLEPNLFLTRIAGSIYQLRVPATPSIVLPAEVDSAGFDILWTHYDTLNPAVAYELLELQGYQVGTDAADDFALWENNGFIVTDTRSNSATTSFYSGEADNLANYIQSEEPYTVESDDTLSFWAWYDIETDWDYAYVEVSTDGMTFTTLPGNLTTNYDPNGNNRGEGITGSSEGWVRGLFDLSAFAGQQIWIRLSYITDGSVTEEGFYVDDIYPATGFSAETIISSLLTDTVYSFTEKPIGVYIYKVRARDAEEQWGLYSPPAQTLVAGSGDCVDYDGDGYGDPEALGNSCPNDNCPSVFNPDQTDTDADGVGDLCDRCPGYDDSVDGDDDGAPDSCDVCLSVADPDQADTDSDGVGDLCDNCSNIPNPSQADADSNGIGDACCCIGMSGNVDCSPDDMVDLGDITALIDHLFISLQPLCCPNEANCDGDSARTVDLGDLTSLIDFLFISFSILPDCN